VAQPKLQIEQRVEELEEQVKRHELAIGTMAQWLVQAQTGFGAHDAAGIEKILRGEIPKEEDSSK
jgi:cell division septum initiation protein DivIVA